MALLYRFVKVNDRGNTRVFSFVVTKTVTRDLHRDVTTKEFPYGFHRWAVTFSRNEKLLGVYLVWRSPSEHMRLYIDFAFSLLNRDHFSGNESFSGKQIKFSKESPAQGNRKFINVGSLYERKFTDSNGEFQLELTMTNVRTVFEADLTVPRPLKDDSRLETSNFTFGNFDWSVTVQRSPEEPQRAFAALRRLTGFEHKCRVRYNLTLGDGEGAAISGILEEVSDREGRGPGWSPRNSLDDLCPGGRLKVICEMLAANTVSELAVGTVGGPMAASCYDRDRQGWSIETDTNGDFLRLKVVYKDIHNIPRNHIKHSEWNLFIIRRHPKGGYMSPSLVARGPFCNYYVHENHDEGIMVETDVPVKELHSPGSLFVDDRHQVLVQLEWLETVLLFQSTYHKYDDISRVHNFQMR
ncbi:hypothetical protein FJT64_008217 [Amphibalanus amphitrite]|uniref:MATH domain-containing protein n=2 Tax=Amphibalanus amphitrite TaxID=1232801 RepID=A0A6A4VHY5_AMPAM|nr:hypothetical protein FJT64_008217 [Amphibalanus amphitrite]